MAFSIPEKETRISRSFTLLPSTVELIEQVADLHNSNASRVVEALCAQYLPKVLAQQTPPEPGSE